MLNGRVYGGSRLRQPANPKHVEPEPEFVEWGYGGMGSNRGASASTAYAKVQSSHKNVVAEDDDDGSGMGWVRKRREAREREKREREEREAAQKGQEQPSSHETDGTSATREVSDTTIPPSVKDRSDSTDLPSDIDGTLDILAAPEHITQAIAIPPVHHHHHHHLARPSSVRRGSGTVTPGSGASIISRPSNDSTHTIGSLASGPPAHSGSSLRNELEVAALESSSQSSDDGDEDDSSNEDGTEREDCREDDEDELEGGDRRTSRCAGIEKISRHKD